MKKNQQFEIKEVDQQFEDYLKDESRIIGKAESISFPSTIDEVILAIEYAEYNKQKITIQGSRTGICAGAVPLSGHILNLSKMNHITGMRFNPKANEFFIDVEAGVTLEELTNCITTKRFDQGGWSAESLEALERMKNAGEFFIACNPTEMTATFGGMAACNAAGPLAYGYGHIRDHIDQLTVVLANKEILKLERKGTIKETIDDFMPSEGTLGVITNLGIKLTKKPAQVWGILSFFDDNEDAFEYVNKFIEKPFLDLGVKVVELEYFDKNTLDLVDRLKTKVTRLQVISEFQPDSACAIYVRLHGEDVDNMETALESIMEWLYETGSDPDTAWAVSEVEELERIQIFRHAVPEAMNDMIDFYRSKDSSVYKLSTDMAIKTVSPYQLMRFYKDDLEKQGLQGAIFGHLLTGHLHVNILPENSSQLKKAEDLLDLWAEKVGLGNGTIYTEHGVGKLKKARFIKNTDKNILHELRAKKEAFDPNNSMGEGNIFSGKDYS